MRWSVCAVLLHHLQRSALSNLLLDNDVEEEDNDDDLFFGVISSQRFLARLPVVKTGHWSLERIFLLDCVRARRGLRMSRRTFVFLLNRIEGDAVFARVSGNLLCWMDRWA
ncbi:hypothetical protein JG687_00007333 [Phytophthora cactorum]|uniref:Secreted protein n=1 Tax=Phytophthora cactorum TaxID=29920 RepID=A0A329S0A2_9STRA|nr:hypothetical protein GQ600_13995 [Phytophthora cactorum]KAG2789874.1 hypothetical protein Pcac1_g1162 [Phytophthora cactorum]KAG2795013.1 hypothetical protein PC112_g22816 [Phytophthora cactorum]KAG2801163.1 hypothetical protein PC111_g19656 [Phytophthora cactorum]KAG2835493.1 hypothetical protein PC113_g20203 [Phytophthora cactorum]